MFRVVKPVVAVTLLMAAGQAQASSFTLDFGNVSSTGFNSAANNVINYGVVANDGVNDIYGQLTTLNAFDSNQDANNGSVSGDVRINAKRGETVQLDLSLFLDASYTTAYTSTSDFEWSLIFYDIDGIDDSVSSYGPTINETNYYDEILLRTEGVATFTDSTVLSYSDTEDGLLVSAVNQAGVDGQSGITTLSDEQQDYTVAYTVENTSSVLFDYIVQDISYSNRARNLLIDGGSLTLTGETISTSIPSPVPLPAGGALLIGGLAALGTFRRFSGAVS